MDVSPLVALGITVSVALVLGVVGTWMRLPKVTSYLIAGLLLGPSVLEVVTEAPLQPLHSITTMAMALVLFNLGAHFSVVFVRKIWRHILPVAFGDLAFTFGVVAFGLYAIGQSAPTALMLGCLAMATAPATTVLVLKELRSEGPVTESAQALVAANNLVTIVAFEVVFIGLALWDPANQTTMSEHVSTLLSTVGVALAVGVICGLLLSYACNVFQGTSWIAMLLAVSSLTLGICKYCDASYMLAFLVMGFVFVNTARESSQALNESAKITAVFCVAFFAIHGAELKMGEFVKLGFVGAAYIGFRCLGKYLGTYLLARWSHESVETRRWLGTSMLSQAGAAIALCDIAVRRDASTFSGVQNQLFWVR